METKTVGKVVTNKCAQSRKKEISFSIVIFVFSLGLFFIAGGHIRRIITEIKNEENYQTPFWYIFGILCCGLSNIINGLLGLKVSFKVNKPSIEQWIEVTIYMATISVLLFNVMIAMLIGITTSSSADNGDYLYYSYDDETFTYFYRLSRLEVVDDIYMTIASSLFAITLLIIAFAVQKSFKLQLGCHATKKSKPYSRLKYEKGPNYIQLSQNLNECKLFPAQSEPKIQSQKLADVAVQLENTLTVVK